MACIQRLRYGRFRCSLYIGGKDHILILHENLNFPLEGPFFPMLNILLVVVSPLIIFRVYKSWVNESYHELFFGDGTCLYPLSALTGKLTDQDLASATQMYSDNTPTSKHYCTLQLALELGN